MQCIDNCYNFNIRTKEYVLKRALKLQQMGVKREGIADLISDDDANNDYINNLLDKTGILDD